ncbi:hypothetical protein EGM97_22825 [Pseudomonas sp. AF32]|uniref:hypothetical protein n=1 Tax=Pseudomonas sp. AF32 TaxID=554390 RepID=UPI001EEEA9F1|nr:hypothetical protein [Pseudomonas sp. AF32]MCG6577527.1 hypothetical protein [Pseudomonas sp. AF32]
MTYITFGLTALLAVSVLTLSGCEQAEKSAQHLAEQLKEQAVETAKKAIDDTHKAAEKALSEATGGLISPEKEPAPDADESKPSTQSL